MAWTVTYYHYDGVGSIRQLTDAAQSVTDAYLYNSYGELQASTGTTVNPFRFVGQYGYYYDPDNRAYYIRARHYLPEFSRWLSRDPLGTDRGPNLYSYVQNCPTSFYDASGREAVYVPGRVTLSDAQVSEVPPDEARDNWLETNAHGVWEVNTSRFSKGGKPLCEEIGIVQIYNEESDAGWFRNLTMRRGWRVDTPNSNIYYPNPYYSSAPTHGDPTVTERLSFGDRPGGAKSIAYLGMQYTKAVTHFETYVIGLKGTEGIDVANLPNALLFQKVYVYAAIKWKHEFVLQKDGTYSVERKITARTPGDMSNLDTALHRFYDHARSAYRE